MNKRRNILLRFDDICPTMNWKQWNQAKSLLDSVGKTALLGVIPDCQDPDLQIDPPKQDFWEYIKELKQQGYAIAMHGYHHVFDIQASGIVTPKKHSEFAGHPYDVQFRKIKKGKEVFLLHGIETDVFFAPAHSYDDNTLKALAANGFKYISDGKSSKPYRRNGIICIPARSPGMSKMRFGRYHTAVFHAHEWIRVDKKIGLIKFRHLIAESANEIIAFDEYKNRPLGNKIIQIANEYLFLLWEHYFRSIIRLILKRTHSLMQLS